MILIGLVILGFVLIAVEVVAGKGAFLAGFCGILCLAAACAFSFTGRDVVTGCIMTAASAALIISGIVWKSRTRGWICGKENERNIGNK